MGEQMPPREARHALRKAAIAEYLGKLSKKRPLGAGKIATTLEGLYAEKGLLVVEKKPDGTVLVSPAPGMPAVPIAESELCAFDDYHEAYRYALEQFPFTDEELK